MGESGCGGSGEEVGDRRADVHVPTIRHNPRQLGGAGGEGSACSDTVAREDEEGSIIRQGRHTLLVKQPGGGGACRQGAPRGNGGGGHGGGLSGGGGEVWRKGVVSKVSQKNRDAVES